LGDSTGIWRIGLDGSAREVARFPGPAFLHDVSADGRMLIHHGLERYGARARGPGEGAEHDVTVNNWNGQIELTNDGRQLLVHDITEPPLGWAFLRPTGGGPPLRLAEGFPLGSSPDGKWVVVNRGRRNAPNVVLTPTGAGETRELSTEGLQDVGDRAWFMDSTHILLEGEEPGRPWRTFMLDLGGGRPRPVTPENSQAVVGTASRGSVIGFGFGPGSALVRYPLDGGEPRPLGVSLPPSTGAIRASADGRFLFVCDQGPPGHIDRLELSTGRRIPWRTLQPEDPAGFVGVLGFAVTPDGAAYAYRYLRFLQDLYLVETLPSRPPSARD